MIHQQKKRILDIYGKEPSTMEELVKCVIAVANSNHSLTQEIKLVGFSWDLRYEDKVANTHCSPLGKNTNWGGDKDEQRSYPGFIGRVWIRYEQKAHSWGSDGMKNTLVHTGSGGAGVYNGPWTNISNQRYKKYNADRACTVKIPVEQCYCYSYDCKIFLDDWPLLAEWIEQQHFWDVLKTDKKQPIVHKFEWNDHKTVEEDRLFLEEVSLSNATMLVSML